jgi:protein-tyrosine phosphatase
VVRVLFVCLGNICRSPTAEGVFRAVVAREGLQDAIEVASAGTADYHVGKPADKRARAAALARGVSLDAHRGRQVAVEDFSRFDYILAMDRENLSALLARCPARHRDRVRLFLEFAPESGAAEVPDPYYGGPDGFEHVLDLCEVASRGLIADIRRTRRP